MRALLSNYPILTALVAVNDEILAKQSRGFDRLLVGKLTHAGNGHPVATQQFAARRSASDSGQRFVVLACQHSFLPLAGLKFYVQPSKSSIGTLNVEL